MHGTALVHGHDDDDDCTSIDAASRHTLAIQIVNLSSLPRHVLDDNPLEISCRYVRSHEKRPFLLVKDECSCCHLQLAVALPVALHPHVHLEWQRLVNGAETWVIVTLSNVDGSFFANTSATAAATATSSPPAPSSLLASCSSLTTMSARASWPPRHAIHSCTLSPLLPDVTTATAVASTDVAASGVEGHCRQHQTPPMPMLNLNVMATACSVSLTDVNVAIHSLALSATSNSTIRWHPTIARGNNGDGTVVYTRCHSVRANASQSSNILFTSGNASDLAFGYSSSSSSSAFFQTPDSSSSSSSQQQQRALLVCDTLTLQVDRESFVGGSIFARKVLDGTSASSSPSKPTLSRGHSAVMVPKTTTPCISTGFSMAIVDAAIPIYVDDDDDNDNLTTTPNNSSISNTCQLCGNARATYQLCPCQHLWACDACVDSSGGATFMLGKLLCSRCPTCRSVATSLCRVVPCPRPQLSDPMSMNDSFTWTSALTDANGTPTSPLFVDSGAYFAAIVVSTSPPRLYR